MLRALLQRPIGLTVSLAVALAISAVLYVQLPVSLLPPIDIPQITVTLNYRNAGPEEIEQNILKPIREGLLTLNGLKTAESVAQNEAGKVVLSFEYGTPMNLAYIEANEKIDRLTPRLPRDLARPAVVRAHTSDIPVIRIQATPRNPADDLLLSELATHVLRRRLEQLPGVGLVDMNGTKRKILSVRLHDERLRALQLSSEEVVRAIRQANVALGSISVQEGAYRYQLRVDHTLTRPEAVENILIRLPHGSSVRLHQVAHVREEPEAPQGLHLYQGREGLVITVHKQHEAKMPELMPEIQKAVAQFGQDYPQFMFATTQDQSQLLTVSIENLSQAVVLGGAIAFAVLFLFMRGWREPLLMGIVLPLSLLLAFSAFRLFGLSLNIISISGLALGLGMLVDNSIVVMESILMKRKQGLPVLDSCVAGTGEVVAPLLSSALTNLAVFVPLIFLSGLTGALFFDQAMSVVAILTVSLFCTFLIVPLVYLLLFRHRAGIPAEDSVFFLWLKRRYERGFDWVWNNPGKSLTAMVLFIPLGVAIGWYLPKQAFPALEKTESFVVIDWNEPIGVPGNRDRVLALLRHLGGTVQVSEADIGQQQYLLGEEIFSGRQAVVYLHSGSAAKKNEAEQRLRSFFAARYPGARFEMRDAPNAFEQLFDSRQPQLEARLRTRSAQSTLTPEQGTTLLEKLDPEISFRPGRGFEQQTVIFLRVDFNRADQLGIAHQTLLDQLKHRFGNPAITTLSAIGTEVPVVAIGPADDFFTLLQTLAVPSQTGVWYPVRELVTARMENGYRYITADAGGIYQSIEFSSSAGSADVMKAVSEIADSNRLLVSWHGEWLENRNNQRDLILILLVSLVLVYVILTAEFESLRQPFIVMLTLPIGLAGSLLFLWIFGGTINVMAGIGLVVVLGVLDNDAILKIDRINRLRKLLPLEDAIRQAGSDRFKPIVMNTCTNVLALTPILFSSGLGAELQQPVAVTTIGGLIVGTLTALYFIPLVFRLMEKTSRRRLY